MRISACAKVFLSFFLLLAGWTCAEAAYGNYGDGGNGGNGSNGNSRSNGSKKDDLRDLPPLDSFQLTQVGDANLMITITGRKLPRPDVVHEGSQTIVTLTGVRWEDKDREHRVRSTPMVTDLTIRQAERDVVVSISTEKPLQLQSTNGTAPANVYTLRLTTVDQHIKMIEEPIVTQQPQTLKVPQGPFAVNTPITLDLRDTELRDVFRLLGLHLKKNIIIDPSLPPALVTMTVRNVPLSEAFNYLMRTYDISYELMGKDTIIVGTTEGMSKVSGKEETRAFRVAYADPEALATLLTKLTKLDADRLIVDPRLRTIYATSHPTKLEEIAIVIQKVDHPGQQVMLHARIVQFNEGDSLQVENTLNAVYDHWWFSYAQGQGSGGFIDDSRVGRNYTPPTGAISPVVTDLLTPMQGTWREFDMAFRALESKTSAKTLANPSVITIDGQEATISLTEDYPYITGRDDGGNASWGTLTVGPQMRITPKVGRDGVITLNLFLQTGDVTGSVAGSLGETMPQTANRTVTTQVRVRDGEPFVVGGLFREDHTNNRLRIPVLGQLPLLGELFTYRTRNTTKTQVVMLVVPYILSTPDAAIDQERVMYRQ